MSTTDIFQWGVIAGLCGSVVIQAFYVRNVIRVVLDWMDEQEDTE